MLTFVSLLYIVVQLAASTLRAGLYKQDSRTMDLYLFVVFSISNYLYSEAKINLNKYIIYIMLINKYFIFINKLYIIIIIYNILEIKNNYFYILFYFKYYLKY